MFGRSVEVISWSDIGNAVGYFEQDDEPLDYLGQVLAGDTGQDFQACPAVVDRSRPLFTRKNPTNTKEKRTQKAAAVVVPALIQNVATCEELAAELGLSAKVVRSVIDLLKARNYLVEAQRSGLLFLTVTTHGTTT